MSTKRVTLGYHTSIHKLGVHCKVWRYFDASKRFFLQNPDPWAQIVYPPRCSSDRASPVDFSIGLCLVGS
jgi:hypothetical protein